MHLYIYGLVNIRPVAVAKVDGTWDWPLKEAIFSHRFAGKGFMFLLLEPSLDFCNSHCSYRTSLRKMQVVTYDVTTCILYFS